MLAARSGLSRSQVQFLHAFQPASDQISATLTGSSLRLFHVHWQVSNWFINARVRLWKPMIEEMYTEEVNPKPADDTSQNPSAGGGVGVGVAIKPEQQVSTAAAGATIGGGGGDHLFGPSYPSMYGSHGGAVSLTLGLQQQPFASTIMHQRRPLMTFQGDEQEPALPYRDLMGSQLLHHFAG